MNLDSILVNTLQGYGFTNATPVQEKTIPLFLEGKDVFAQAKTGSGKTAAFAIPILQKIIESSNRSEDHYLILCPTRELAQQTYKIISELGKDIDVKAVNVIGGESIEDQTKKIQKGVDVIVGTPGRINDLSKQKILNLSMVKAIIFDEVDRLFDMGFKKEIEYILKAAPQERQLIMLSATNNQEVLRTAYRFHSNPEEVLTGGDDLLVKNIDDRIAMLSEEEKFPYLVNLLRKHEDVYAIIFCNTQYKTHLVAEWLKKMGLKTAPISGRLPQNKRTRLMEDFRTKVTTLLVCTDVAARGLDIKNVDLVVNYDLPSEAANYVHRIGRTGRAGNKGEAIGLCGHDDCLQLDAIQELIGKKIEKLMVQDKDFATDICKKPRIDGKTFRLLDGQNSRSERPKREDRKQSTQKPASNNPKKQNTNKPKSTKEKTPMNETFTITTSNLNQAKNEAMQFFKVKSTDELSHKVTATGKKKFFFFGPRKCTYVFKVGLQQVEEITHFVESMIKKMYLDLNVETSTRGNTIKIDLKGEDIGLVLTNRKQLLMALDHVLKQFLFKRVNMPKGTKVFLNAIGENPKPQRTQQRSNGQRPAERKDRDDRSASPRKPRRDSYKNRSRSNQNKGPSDKDLVQMANDLKQKVIENGAEAISDSLNAAQRRIIHTHLQDDPQVETSSIGDGRYKKVKVYLA